MKSRAQELREKPLARSLLALSLPVVAMSLLQSMFQLTDTFWVGRLGGTALAAVAVNFPILFLIVALGSGAATAGFILVAQFSGAEDRAMVTHVSMQSMILMLMASLLLGTLGYLAGPQLLTLLGVPPDVHADAVRYLRPMLIGVPFMFTQICVQALLRGLGEVRLPLMLVLLSVLLNLILDPLLIFGWGPVPASGISGAAYATIVTQFVSAVLGIFYLYGGRFGVQLRGAQLALDTGMARKLLRLGVRGTVEQSARGFGMMVMMIIVTGFGTAAVATYGIVMRLWSLVMVPAMSLSMASGTLIGHSIGADEIDRAKKIARTNLAVLFVGLAACGAIVFGNAASIVRFFVPGDAALVQDAAHFLRILAPFFALTGIQIAHIGVFRGAGDMLAAMTLAVCAVWVFELPIAYVLSRFTTLGTLGIWWAYPCADVLAASLAFAMYRRRKWHSQNLLGQYRGDTRESTSVLAHATSRSSPASALNRGS